MQARASSSWLARNRQLRGGPPRLGDLRPAQAHKWGISVISSGEFPVIGDTGTLARYVLVAARSCALRLGRRLTAVFALLSCSCRAEGRSGSPARRAGRSRGGSGNAAYVAVQARLITGACSSSDWTAPSVWRPPGEAPVANQGHGHAGVLEHLEGGRFKSAAPALRLLAFWVERRVVPPVSHVNITMFDDCDLACSISEKQTHCPMETPGSRAMET
jgi:hypothetical protein